MAKLQLTVAAQLNIDETGCDRMADVNAVRRKEHDHASLLAHCLEGADADRVQGWRDYVDAVVAYAEEYPNQGLGNWDYEGYWNAVLYPNRDADGVVEEFDLAGLPKQKIDEWLGAAEAESASVGGLVDTDGKVTLPDSWTEFHEKALAELVKSSAAE